MRTLSFLFALIAIGLLGGWYWLSQQDTVQLSNSAPAPIAASAPEDVSEAIALDEPMMEEFEPAPLPAPRSAESEEELDAAIEAFADMTPEELAEAIESLPAPAAGAPVMESNRFSVASNTETPITGSTAPPPSELDNFKSRPIAYNRPPQILSLGTPVDVSLVIDSTSEANPAAGLEGFEGEIVERDVSLSDEVSAQLTGAAFEIDLMSVDRQRLSSRVQNRWQWRVTPTQEGEHNLLLEIFGYESGSSAAEPLDAYRDRISVEVRDLDRLISVAKAYEPLMGIAGGIAGVFSALFAFFRFASRKKTS